MSKLLIIGASVLQLPAIRKAKDLGHYVAVADYDPKAVGIVEADEYYNASTIDIDAIVEVAKKFRPNGIMTLATDMPMRSVAAATTALGLCGISMDTAIKATDKAEMIKAFKSHGVESPWFVTVSSLEGLKEKMDGLTYPCIMKPTDNAGSRGVTLVHSPHELLEAYSYSLRESRSGNVIIEEYLSGHEVSVEMMMYKGEANVLAVTDKRTTGAPYFVETGHSQPSILPRTDLEKIHDLAKRAVKAVGIENGPAHVEIMDTPDGPRMIELGARMGGDCITTHLVPLSTGIDMVKATIDISLGLQPDITPKFHKGSAICFVQAPEGILRHIDGLERASNIPGVQEVTIQKTLGTEIGLIHSSLDRTGYIVAQADTPGEAMDVCNKAKNEISFTVE